MAVQKTKKVLKKTQSKDSRLKGLDSCLAYLKVFLKINGEFPLHYMIALIEIAQNEGMSLTELAKKTNLTLSTVSRIVGALSDYRANGKPYELVDLRISKTERRRKELYLTVKGRTLIKRLEKVAS